MKRIALAGLILALLLSPAVRAQEGGGLAYVSLEDAVALAWENSLSLALSRLNVLEAELNLQQARANNLVQPSPTALLQAERQAEIARRQLLLDQFDLKLEVEEAYYAVLRAQNLVAVLEEALRVPAGSWRLQSSASPGGRGRRPTCSALRAK